MFINNTCNLFDFIYSVKECEDPGDVANATKYGGFRYGDSVTYTCYPRFYISSGDRVLQCTDSKQWLGTKPVCSSKKLIML